MIFPIIVMLLFSFVAIAIVFILTPYIMLYIRILSIRIPYKFISFLCYYTAYCSYSITIYYCNELLHVFFVRIKSLTLITIHSQREAAAYM